jgi:hypothetical protein
MTPLKRPLRLAFPGRLATEMGVNIFGPKKFTWVFRKHETDRKESARFTIKLNGRDQNVACHRAMGGKSDLKKTRRTNDAGGGGGGRRGVLLRQKIRACGK